MGAITSQITSLTIVHSTVYSDADQRKYQSSASLAFVWGIHRGPVNSPHKWPVTRKMLPFDDVMCISHILTQFVVSTDLARSRQVVTWGTSKEAYFECCRHHSTMRFPRLMYMTWRKSITKYSHVILLVDFVMKTMWCFVSFLENRLTKDCEVTSIFILHSCTYQIVNTHILGTIWNHRYHNMYNKNSIWFHVTVHRQAKAKAQTLVISLTLYTAFHLQLP